MVTTLASLILVAAQATTSVHVEGDGYLRFVRDGRTVYAKGADLTVAGDVLAHADGPVVSPRIQVLGEPMSIHIDLGGTVYGTYSNGDQDLGRLVLAIFPDDVRPVVDGAFLVSSFRPSSTSPGESGAGLVVSKQAALNTGVPSAGTSGTSDPGAVVIRLRETAEVATDDFVLGDIASVTADPATRTRIEAFEIARTPALGVKYRMSPSMVRTRLMRSDKLAEDYEILGAGQVTVTRTGQTVTHSQFVQAAIRGAKAELGDKAVLSGPHSGAAVVAPLGQLQLLAERVGSSGSRVNVTVAVFVEGKRFNSRTIHLDNSDPLSKMRIGQNVKVLVRSNAALVETSGKIKTLDRTAGTVVVKTVTGAELIGTVTGINTVEVKL